MTTATGVVIAGAGPVGLMLACELRTANVPVVIVERLATPMTESRASQITTLTAELLHERGFGELLGEAVHEPRAHYGGVSFTLSDLDSDYAGNWKVPQHRTERALGQRAEQLGAVVLRGHELSWVRESGDHVSCGASGPAGEVRLRARYLAGCDGAGSTVRDLCGITTARTGPTRELLRADVTGIDIRERRFELLDQGFAVASASRGVTRVMVHAFGQAPRKRTAPPSFGEVARAWAAVTGEDISGGTATWVDSFDNASGLAGCYRRGRVLLAGDAAHWHMPIGGQAMNVGLQDAVNLGWKLAGAVRGWASPQVLDSYDSERRPIAASVLSQVAAQETVLLGGREAGALRSVLAELLGCAPVRGHLARVVSGLADSYGPAGAPLAGRRLPRAALLAESGPVTTADVTAGGKAAAILRFASPGKLGDRRPDAVLSRPGGIQLRSVHVTAGRAAAFDGVTAILLRPDGYVAWAGDDEAGLLASTDFWFGAGSGPRASLAEPPGQR